MPWIVAVSKPNQEAIAGVHLQRQGFNFYYPRYLHRKNFNEKPTIRPLFPRYVFVEIEQMWRSLTGTRGISYILLGEDSPQTLPDPVIAGLKAREDTKGLYQLAEPPKFLKGERVKATEGPFQGLPLFYEGMTSHDRVRVLVEMLGRKCPVILDEEILAAA